MQEWVYLALICISTVAPDYKAEEQVTTHFCNQLQSVHPMTFEVCETKRKEFEIDVLDKAPGSSFDVSVCVTKSKVGHKPYEIFRKPQ